MEVLLLILGLVCMLVGLVGSVLPVLPGLPICYLGFLLLQWSAFGEFSSYFLIAWAVIILIMVVIEYLIPKWGTKNMVAPGLARTEHLWGTIVGVFVFPPLGLLLGPFVGAYVGELIDDSENNDKALRSAWGSLVGFMAGSVLKVTVALVMLFFFIREWIL